MMKINRNNYINNNLFEKKVISYSYELMDIFLFLSCKIQSNGHEAGKWEILFL